MKILAIETATEACSASLYLDGMIHERFEVAPRRHTELIVPMVRDLLAETQLKLEDLDVLAFGRGPGSFTGVRIAAGVVQGMALGADLPVVPVSTLEALALEALEESEAKYALVALDARMKEIYWGVYRRERKKDRAVTIPSRHPLPSSLLDEDPAGCFSGPWLSRIEETVVAPERVVVTKDAWKAVAIGPGWTVYGEVLRRRIGDNRLVEVRADRLPRASQVAKLAAVMSARGEGVRPEMALPVYLRNQVAQTLDSKQ